MILCAVLVLTSPGCGDGGGSATGDDVDAGDGSGGGIDAAIASTCADNPACSNCIDDDGDGLVDGFDPECISAEDDREDSFATGIPGDNIDPVEQDCFFDGDSGHGNDGCRLHTCCFLDGECPADLMPDKYDPEQCTPSQDCIDFCQPLTPPGCDCFGCCTICDGGDCSDVYTNPAVAPDCTLDQLDNPDVCPPCTKVEACGPGECNPLECNLCPGQTADDLPPECQGENACPTDSSPCATSDECGAGQFCSVGCCINQVG